MKISEKLSKLTTEELNKKRDIIRISVIALVTILIILLFLTSYITIIEKKFNPLLIIPFALSPIVFLNISNLTKIKEEIAKRNH